MSGWALLVCAVLFLCVHMPANHNPDLGGEERGSESANSFFYSLFPISLSTTLRLTGLTCLSLTVRLKPWRRRKGIEERRYVSPHQGIKLYSWSLLHLAGSCCCVCVRFSASSLKTDSSPCGSKVPRRKEAVVSMTNVQWLWKVLLEVVLTSTSKL